MRKAIEAMDKKSEEFFELFKLVNDKYFDFDAPDEYQQSAKLVNTILHGGEEWLLVMVGKLMIELLKIVEHKQEASHGTFHCKDVKVLFDFYTNDKSKHALHAMLRNTISVKAEPPTAGGEK